MEKKKILAICTLLILVIGIVFLSFPNHNNKRVNKSNSDNLIRLGDSAIALMIETTPGSGEYELSSMNTWPTKGYIYNEKLSYCENGSQLIYDETNGLQLKTSISDKCYIYYDISADLAVSISYNGTHNMPRAVGPSVSLNCWGSTAEYNNQYNRIEVSEIGYQNANCNLTYTDRTSKTYLNNKIIGLAGTTQGTGQVVNESFVEGNYTNATKLTQSQYGTVSQYYSTSATSTSGTVVTNAFSFSSNQWVSNPSNMTDKQYYHLNFTSPSDGYYQFCYELSPGHENNTLSVFVDGTRVRINGWTSEYADPNETISGCVDLGYATANTEYRIVQRAYTEISTFKFYLSRTTSTKNLSTGYRYEGKNPNNYVWFNNELWRIIGVFGSDSHGISGQNLTKIIRNEAIGGLAWNKENVNDWTTASLRSLLNGAYYNRQDGTQTEYCYGYGHSNIKTNCDYRINGISPNYRNMIKEATWYLGSASSDSDLVLDIYKKERAGTKKVANYIGLMYISDFGFSPLASNCSRDVRFNNYSNINYGSNGSVKASCKSQSWLYSNGNEWSLTTNFSSDVFYIKGWVSTSNNSPPVGYNVRPTLYLDSNVYVISGTGTIIDPYIIGM